MKNRKTTVFATVLTLAVITLLIIGSLTSCSQAEVMATPKGVGFVRFSDANTFALRKSVEIMAYIDYPDEYSLTWTVTASKTDTNGKQGEGVYEDVLLTDTLGPFSVGSWHFTLEGRGEKNRLIYTGETDKTIGEGNNTVHVDIAPPQEGNGYIRIQGSNFDPAIGDCFRVTYGDNDVGLMNMPPVFVRTQRGRIVQYTRHQHPGAVRCTHNQTVYRHYPCPHSQVACVCQSHDSSDIRHI